jgi:hypothetical protein
MKHCFFLVSTMLVFVAFTACERVDQAVDTYKKAKELKSDFQKKSDDAQKGIADKTEDFKDRIQEKVGLTPGGEGRDGDEPDRKDKRDRTQESQGSHGDKN